MPSARRSSAASWPRVNNSSSGCSPISWASRRLRCARRFGLWRPAACSESYPSRGVVVRQANAKLVEDLYEYRLLLEPAAVRMAVPHQNPDALRQLQDKLDLGQQLGEEHNLSELSRLNRSFHEGLYQECRNELVKSALDGMGDQLAFVAAAGWRATSSWNNERREHTEILQAVIDGDAVKADELIARPHRERLDPTAGRNRLIGRPRSARCHANAYVAPDCLGASFHRGPVSRCPFALLYQDVDGFAGPDGDAAVSKQARESPLRPVTPLWTVADSPQHVRELTICQAGL
ncbi:MAG: FCD domain-containing protein [Geodermatophilaceae bacterium]